ncbi:DUF1569 domain-containing protein [Singulisphaera sp. PoT]|uniref:DUF1569 domain-containing protein n=1 Tax=Singulisphaera sp. PoT TaxID=3411797 RepID=UPI003BF49CBA
MTSTLDTPMLADGRRDLKFATMDRVMPDIDNLLLGYRQLGNWSLGQICNHLTMVIQGSVAGFGGRAPWIVRKAIGPIVLRQIFKAGCMKPGRMLPKKFWPNTGLDDRAEAEAMRATLYYFAAHMEGFADHPIFGPLSREQWTRLHCIHCAHHLSFLVPEPDALAPG